MENGKLKITDFKQKEGASNSDTLYIQYLVNKSYLKAFSHRPSPLSNRRSI